MQRQDKRRATILKMVTRIMQEPHKGDFTSKLFDTPGIERIRRIILSFLIGDFNRIVLICGRWYVGFHDILKEQLEELDNKFIKTYLPILSFKNSDFHITPFTIGLKKSFRWDRTIYAEVLPGHAGKCVTIGFRYHQKYQCQYKFDVLDVHQKRKIWIMKEDTKHNFNAIPQTGQILPIVVGDCIKININFFNKIGYINPDSIEFDPPHFEPTIPRECPIEKLFFDWVFYKFYTNKPDPQKFSLGPQLRMIDFRCAGIDTIAYQFLFEGDQKGNILTQTQGLIRNEMVGIPIEVVHDNHEVVTEIKKYGLASDLPCTIQLRKYDQLSLYWTMGD